MDPTIEFFKPQTKSKYVFELDYLDSDKLETTELEFWSLKQAEEWRDRYLTQNDPYVLRWLGSIADNPHVSYRIVEFEYVFRIIENCKV